MRGTDVTVSMDPDEDDIGVQLVAFVVVVVFIVLIVMAVTAEPYGLR